MFLNEEKNKKHQVNEDIQEIQEYFQKISSEIHQKELDEIADVVRNLSFKQKEKGLSTGEKKMLNNAKQILVSELVLAEHASQEEVEQLVENKINNQ